jgi:hypothetical protein
VDAVPDPRLIPPGGDWCSCAAAPWFVNKPFTLLDHDETCGFPVSPCSVRAHRITVHEGCGRPMPVRFCGCQPSGYSFDVERGWWVHYYCGWPTRAWLTAHGALPPDDLLGIRPATFHEFVPVPRSTSPKSAYAHLSDEQRRLNAHFTGGWVRD